MKRQLLEQGRFATTQWQMVRQASDCADDERIEALDQLLRTYCPALIEYLKRQYRLPEDRAEDVVQGFVTDQVLIKNLLSKASQDRGRFRTFLLNSIQRYTNDRIRRDKALKRRPANGFTSLTDGQAETLEAPPSDSQHTFDDIFARQVIAEAIQRTHQRCLSEKRMEIWEILHARIFSPLLEDIPTRSYDELVAELGLRNSGEAQNRLASGKRMFKRYFRAVVEEFAADEQELEEELAYLRKFFRSDTQDSAS